MKYSFTNLMDYEIEMINKETYSCIYNKWIQKSKSEFNNELHDNCYNLFTKYLNGKRILDIGCGIGYDSKKFYNDNYEIYSIDIELGFVSNLKKEIRDLNCIVMDIKKPSFKYNTFDGLFSMASFIHIPLTYSIETLDNFYLLLKERGILFISHVHSLDNEDGYIVNDVLSTKKNLFCFCMSKTEIKRNLLKVGFRKILFFDLLKKRTSFLENNKLYTYQLLAFK